MLNWLTEFIDGIGITIDIDWAPDVVIDYVAAILLKHQTRATWFVTHASPAVERLRLYPELFELGIHPNFLPSSTHGATPSDVLRHCMSLVPDALCMRTHALVQSTPLLALVLEQTPIRVDASLYLPYFQHALPFEYHWRSRTLLRIPYFWEDDFEMERPVPQWQINPILELDQRVMVFDFHPIHIYLNSANVESYTLLKQENPHLHTITDRVLSAYVQPGLGTGTFFKEVVEQVATAKKAFCLRDLYDAWQTKK